MSINHALIPNFRSLLPLKSDYVDFNREERHFSAILFHLLLQPGGVEKFIALVRAPTPPPGAELQVFFEYTQLRDRFSEIARRCHHDHDPHRQILRDAILRMLPQSDALSWLSTAAPRPFNEFFCGPSGASETYYQMPSRWSPTRRFDDWHAKDPEFAKQACRMAWAFNAKPDLVIHTSEDTLICVEIKVESGEGAYKVPSKHCSDGYFRSSQLDIQRHALQNLLGYRAHFVLLSPSESKKRTAEPEVDCCLIWKDALEGLSNDSERPFVQRMLKSAFLRTKRSADAQQ